VEPTREARSPVLVVSNDPAVRDMLANLLSEEGFHVALAGSGTEALKIATNAPFDTALVELFLPDYSGVEFKRRLARVSPKTRVVVLSSFTTIRSSDDVLRFGTSDFILDQREIVELLRSAAAARPAIAKPAEVVEATGFEPGGVAPFPLERVPVVLVERTLVRHPIVWAGAGSDRHMVALAPRELVRLTRGRVEDVVRESP